MQRRYIDHTDFNHLVNTLSQDFKPLNNRIKKLEQVIRHSYGTIKSRSDSNNEIWKSPVSKNLWSIYYIYSSYKNKIEVDFYPFTEFSSSDGEKEFLLLSKIENYKLLGSKLISLEKFDNTSNKNSFKDYLIKNNLFLIIFRGHFIDRFRNHTSNTHYPNFEVMLEFSINPNLVLVDNFQQNQDWLMCLHSKGVAMIQLQDNYAVFDTYVPKYKLKDDQITAITNHLNGLDDIKYGAVSMLLLRSTEWIDFIDKARLMRFLLNLASRSPEIAKNLIDLHYEGLTNLFGKQFMDSDSKTTEILE